MKYDIFICYARVDSVIVNTFVSKLKSAGFTVWIDKDGLYVGTKFKRKIVRAIEDSQVFLFFSSKDSNVSQWTAKEIGIAADRKKLIIPIKIDDTHYSPDLELDLINLDFVDYKDKSSRNQEFNKLKSTLDEILKKPPPPPPPPKGIIEKIISKILLLIKRHNYTIAIYLFFLMAAISAFLFYLAKPNQHNSDVLSSSNSVDDIQLIDLGLPSGTLWADRNLGASAPGDYGMHFAWGETKQKEEYSMESYSYEYISDDGASMSIGRPRIEVDENNNLVSKCDAATVLLGTSFRMPTRAEMLELINCCTWKKEGILYRITGPNENSIYLPLVYHVENRENFDTFYYWTSTKHVNKAWVLEIDSTKNRQTVDAYTQVFVGCPIRPVSKIE